MRKTRIMVFGTFDGLHLGHLNLFKQARKLAQKPYLIVVIARDKNVLRIKKRKTFNNEKKRLSLVKKAGLADKVILGKIDNYFENIRKEKPDIIALGYDQRAYVLELKKDLQNLTQKTGKKISTKIIRLKPYKKHIYKNSLLRVTKANSDK